MVMQAVVLHWDLLVLAEAEEAAILRQQGQEEQAASPVVAVAVAERLLTQEPQVQAVLVVLAL
jgi:hypothetical protein